MPQIGLVAKTGTLMAWRYELGDEVLEGQVLCEIETDKAMTELESPADGVLLRRLEPEVEVPVGEPIAVIGAPSEDVDGIALFGDSAEPAAAPPVAAESAERAPAESAPARAGGGRVSPAARARARELGIEIPAGFTGSGPAGRVKRADVDRLAAAAPASGARRAVAAAMTLSATIPQFALERVLDVTELHAELAELGDEARPTVVDALAVAAARAVAQEPAFLRVWQDEGYVTMERVAVGVAVALDEGLIVPVVQDADGLAPAQFAAERRRLQERAREGRLSVSESSGAALTISNLGPFGIDRFQALVTPGQAGVIAVGRLVEQDGRMALSATLSADHRVVDGVHGARLLASIADQLERTTEP